MLNRLDYSYNSEESIVHRLNPVIKILGLIIYVLLCLLEFNNFLFILSIGFVFTLLLFSNIKMSKYLKIIWKLKYMLIIIYMFMIYKEFSFYDMNIIVFRFVFLILYLMMMLYTTTKKDLSKGSAIVLDLFNIVGFSLKKFINFFYYIYLYPSVFLDTYVEVFINLEIKGKNYTHSNIIDRLSLFIKNVKLIFLKTNKKMKYRSINMKYRFYNSNVKCQYKYRNKLCIFDYLFIIVNVGMLVFHIMEVRL